MAQTTSTSLRTVIIEGLRKVRDVEQDGWEATFDKSSGLSKVSMTLREDDTLDSLWKRIEVCGFQRPRKVENGGIEFDPLIPAYLIRDYDEVHVVGDDEASTPTTIKISETLMSHSNTHHFVPIEFSIDAHTSRRELKDNIGLSISFERTPRMPDDNKLHQLPGSLGQFELFSVDAYSERLPNKITDAGGVFFPMWQREAMWINFRSMYQGAMRVFVGRVNAISGRSMEEALDKQDDSHVQDYIVIPDQQWLDGICVAPGIVRQFVAMSLGSGYTVEGQKTSEEKHGGLQIEITPETKTNLRFWSYAKHDFIRLLDWMGSYDGLDENSTPQELGCKVGDVLKSYPTDAVYQKHFRIQDLNVSDVGQMEEDGASQKVVLLWATPLTTHPLAIRYISRIPSTTYHGGGYDPNNTKKYDIHIPHTGGGGYDPSAIYHNDTDQPVAKRFNFSDDTNLLLESESRSKKEYAFSKHSKLPQLASQIASQAGYIDYQDTKKYTAYGNAPFPLKGTESEGEENSVDDGQPRYRKGRTDDEEEEMDGEESTDSVKKSEIQAKDIKAMGLAAGGKLIQDIYKDPYPATTWNHAAACILNVHILDPESCEKVTHVVPRPPPIDVKEYVESGGQFFVVEEKVNERIEGGDFDNVKSVSQMDQHVGITTEPEFDPSKPKMCTTCEIRLCDCIIRPCDHQFCNVCIKRLEQSGEAESSSQQGHWKCPTCSTPVSHVAGFSAPMNLPGEEPVRTRVPVNVLKIEDGRMRFSSIHNSRI